MGIKKQQYDEKSCGLVVFRRQGPERLYLVLHYPSGHWDFPKGHVEEDEDEYQTAQRELQEETGIEDVQIFDGFREPISYCYTRNHKKSHKQVVFFLARTDQSEVSISHEHQNHDWLPYLQALDRVTFDNAKNLLKLAEKFLSA